MASTAVHPARRLSTAHDAPPTISTAHGATTPHLMKDKAAPGTPSNQTHADDGAEDTSPPPPPIKIKVGDLYWRAEGPCGWTLGQVTAHDVAAETVRFCLIDEASGELLPHAEPETLHLPTTPVYAANPLFNTTADMTSLRHLHEAAIAKNLEDRSSIKNLRPYTFMANVLIAVNPLKKIDDPDKQLFVSQSLDRCPPHPYYIAENAYRQLCAVRAVMQNQSIIISGESGSGKTETSKIILDFLTTRAVRVSRAPSCASEDDMEPELTPRVVSPPTSETAALSFPQSNNGVKLSPVTLGGRLMETIPILESFGNAKTHRNHNSSRFGKYMRLQFSTAGHELTGASIDTYLLEKSRLVHQPKGERNFHVFYELLYAEDTEYIESRLHLEPKQPEKYSFLNQSGCMKAEFMDDALNFKSLCKALQFVGINDQSQDEIYRVVGGLLHMGNITIREEDTSEGKTACVAANDQVSQEALAYAAELLGVCKEELSECILMKRIVATRGGSRRGSIYYAKKDQRTAVYSRDTIAKTIYEHVFNWLMVQCASALDYDATRADVIPYIGVLDIFGFEDFEPKNRNSFEQLLINYANEALQSLFNDCVFEAEQELYRSENIDSPTNHSLSFPFPMPGMPIMLRELTEEEKEAEANDGGVVQYSDNRECLNLIASRHGGIFVTIDNVSRLPGPSDRKLNERLHTLFKRHPNFPTPHPKDVRDTFIIRHYAGVVRYTIDSFVDKNNNIISDQFEELITRSTSRILQEITGRNSQRNFSNQAEKNNASKSRQKGGSASSLFSTQMKGLITELEGTSCNFIRCIKPNTLMKPGIFDKPYVVEQLRCSGTVQACEVLRVGLPTRILYAEVVDVYKTLLPPDMFQRFEFNDKLFTQAILWIYDFPTSAYRLGDTRLFFRTGKIDLLDRLLTPSSAPADCNQLASKMIQFVHRKRWINVATKMIAYNAFKKIYFKCKFRRKAEIIQCFVRQYLARKRVRKIRTQLRIHKLWSKMADRARTMDAYQDLPEDKMVLLHKLLAKNYLPQGQRWLLKWLGPLARVLYMQKLWKKITAQYAAKRGFLWLFKNVRRKRACVRVQAMVRVMSAKKQFRRLKQARLARERWQRAYLKVRVFCVFRRELYRIHVDRLETENAKLSNALQAAQAKIRKAEQEAETMRVKYQQLQILMDQKTMRVAEQEKKIDKLEHNLESTQDELNGIRQKFSGGLFERMVRFFTCSSTPSSSPPLSPSSKQNLMPPSKARILVTTKTFGPIKLPSKSIVSSDEEDEEPEDDEDEDDEEVMMTSRVSDPLYSMSRFCF